MNPGERVETILEVAKTLEDLDWATVNLYLESFGLPTDNWWNGDTRQYVIAMLKDGSDDSLLQLLGHLNGANTSNGSEILGRGFLLFISHISKHKMLASEIARALQRYGIRSFVAHEQIDPGSVWIDEIQAKLGVCNALLALHHDGFSGSDWTSQEIGWVLGRGLPVLSIRFDEDPRGFVSRIQAIAGSRTKDAIQIAEEVVELLMKESRTKGSVVSAVIDRISRSTSWDTTNLLFRFLDRNGVVPTREQVVSLMEAELTNVDVQKAHEWLKRRERLAEYYGIEITPASD